VDAKARETSDADADGEVVWFWRLDAGVKFLRSKLLGGDGDNKPITEESAKETVKTIAQGMPGDSGEPVVTTVCLLPSAHGPWVHRASGIPCSLYFGGAKISCRPRANRAAGSRRCIWLSLLFEM
jgi:hypothetical protein